MRKEALLGLFVFVGGIVWITSSARGAPG
jgi:hypothetical protein